MIKPFSPDEALAKKYTNIPEFVIEAINELLARKITSSGHAYFEQDDAVEAIIAKMPVDLLASLTNHSERRHYVFDNNLLDFEALYRDHGWKVQYNRKCIGDSGPSSYTLDRAK